MADTSGEAEQSVQLDEVPILLVAHSGHKKLSWRGPLEGHASKYLQVTFSYDRLKQLVQGVATLQAI